MSAEKGGWPTRRQKSNRAVGVAGAEAVYAAAVLVDREHALLHQVGVDDQLGVGAHGGAPGLQQVQLVVLDGELQVQLVLKLALEQRLVLLQARPDVGGDGGHAAGDDVAHHHVLALRHLAVLAEQLVAAVDGVAREDHAAQGIGALVAEDHLLHGHGRAEVHLDGELFEVFPDIMRAAGGEDQVYALDELLERVLQESRAQFRGHQLLGPGRVGFGAAARRRRGNFQGQQHVAQEAQVDAGGESGPVPAGQLPADGGRQAGVEDGAHGAGQRDGGAGAHRHQQRVLRRAQAPAGPPEALNRVPIIGHDLASHAESQNAP